MKGFIQLIVIFVILGVAVSVPTYQNISDSNKSASNCNCGRRNWPRELIVGGKNAGANEFPWRCYLGYRNKPFCGCSIISNQWVMTAGHCSDDLLRYNIKEFEVVVGAHDWTKRWEYRRQSFKVSIEDFIRHPEYKNSSVSRLRVSENDIALIKLPLQLTFSKAVSPVCLPFKYAGDDFRNEKVVASGWGDTSEGGFESNTLKSVELPVLTTERCSKYYPGKITENMICTYNPGKDTCQGDSGGSIDLNRNRRYYAIGVVSWGIGCAQYWRPGVYTKTTNYLKFIQDTTKEQFCET